MTAFIFSLFILSDGDMMATMMRYFRSRWEGQGGYAELLRIALPLILSMSMHVIQTFVDRVFLMGHATDEVTAALPAAVTHYAFASVFVGLVSYVNTFVAQYVGARRPQRVGPAVWQGMYLALVAGLLLLGLIPAAGRIFAWFGHAPEVQKLEIAYFQWLCVASLPLLLHTAGWCFFTGRGKTWVVFSGYLAATAVNIVLDYGLIYGHGPFPEMGIVGAAWATGIAHCVSLGIFMVLFLRRSHRTQFATLSGLRVESDLCKRMIRFGLPQGVQHMLEVLAFTLLLVFVGRTGKVALTASNIALEINFLAFMPLIGLGQAVTVLVGQALGRNDPASAQRTTWSAFQMTYACMTLIAFGYFWLPEFFMWPFAASATDPDQFAELAPMIELLLKFVAFYCLFDTGNIIFAAALRGAGDTRFVMVVTLLLGWGVMVLPAGLAIHYGWGPRSGLDMAWLFLTIYVCLLALTFLGRFLHGHWKTMRVIEQPPSASLLLAPELPTVEVEAP